MKPLKQGIFYWQKETASSRVSKIIERLTKNKTKTYSECQKIAKQAALRLSNNHLSTLRACGYGDFMGRPSDIIKNGINITARNRLSIECAKSIVDDATNYCIKNKQKHSLIKDGRIKYEIKIKLKSEKIDLQLKQIRKSIKQIIRIYNGNNNQNNGRTTQ
jgi:hypothetical protein